MPNLKGYTVRPGSAQFGGTIRDPLTPADIPAFLGSIAPNTGQAGAPDVAITATGHFFDGDTLVYAGTELVTTFVDATHISASIPTAAMTQAGSGSVYVKRSTDGSMTRGVNFTVTAPGVTGGTGPQFGGGGGLGNP